jgi:hypothetical protein
MTTRKTAARRAPRKTSAARARSTRRDRPPVETLPQKYDAYFRRVLRDPGDRRALDFCCRCARALPLRDAKIGARLAKLTRSLSKARPELGITEAEIAAIGAWPAEQLRTFRGALIEIFGPVGCGAPKRARFRGLSIPGRPSITVRHGATIDVTFAG